jgi:hypothetical protein
LRFRYSPYWAILLFDWLHLLCNGERLAGQERFVTFQVADVAVENTGVGSDNVTVLE